MAVYLTLNMFKHTESLTPQVGTLLLLVIRPSFDPVRDADKWHKHGMDKHDNVQAGERTSLTEFATFHQLDKRVATPACRRSLNRWHMSANLHLRCNCSVQMALKSRFAHRLHDPWLQQQQQRKHKLSCRRKPHRNPRKYSYS